MNNLSQTLTALMPVAYAFAEKQEKTVLDQGRPLSESELSDARRAGVKSPEKVRVMYVDVLPQPHHDDALFTARQLGLYQPHSAGLSMGYGVCIRKIFASHRDTLVHELVHVAQYERIGGVRPFLDVYLRECIEPGYPFGRLEQEAVHVTKDICKTS